MSRGVECQTLRQIGKLENLEMSRLLDCSQLYNDINEIKQTKEGELQSKGCRIIPKASETGNAGVERVMTKDNSRKLLW